MGEKKKKVWSFLSEYCCVQQKMGMCGPDKIPCKKVFSAEEYSEPYISQTYKSEGFA